MIPEIIVVSVLIAVAAVLFKSNHQLRKKNLELQIKLAYTEGDLETARETLQTAKPILTHLARTTSPCDPLMPDVVHAHASVKVVSAALERGIDRYKGVPRKQRAVAA